MLDDYTKRGMILRAALRLAEEKGWRALTMPDIARSAGVTLADLYREFPHKPAILLGFVREVDRAVLRRARPSGEDSERDRLFDVLMTRFEVMAPYKAAVRRIAADLRNAPGQGGLALACASLRSHYWMLTAAGLRAEAPEGCWRVPGLAAVYARAFDVWLRDDDPGLARTMAALDRRLRRGERMVGWIESACAEAEGMFSQFVPGAWRRESDTASGPQAGTGAERPHAG